MTHIEIAAALRVALRKTFDPRMLNDLALNIRRELATFGLRRTRRDAPQRAVDLDNLVDFDLDATGQEAAAE
jgi:hypothetical protein